MKSAIRTLELFETFGVARRPLTLTDLAAALDVPVSSCFGLVNALAGRGYLQPAGEKKAFYPTRKMLRCTETIAAHEPVVARLIPRLRRLRDETKETVILGQAQANWRGVIYLEVLEGPQSIRYSASIGDIKPLHSSSIGKALLSSLDPSALDAVLQKLAMEKVTRNTITAKARLKADIAAGLERGYQMTVGENVADVGAVAAPLVAENKTYGIAIAAPLSRMDGDRKRLTALLAGAMADLASRD